MRQLTFQFLSSKYVQEFSLHLAKLQLHPKKGGAFALDGVLLACGVVVGVCLKKKVL